MIEADLSRQLMIRIGNEAGRLAEITGNIASSDINLIALCAYEVEDMVTVMLVTDDNNEAKRLLEEKAFNVQEEEVILLTVENKPGALEEVTTVLSENDIDLHLVYGSVDKDSQTCRMVLFADNNLDAMMVIKTLMERS